MEVRFRYNMPDKTEEVDPEWFAYCESKEDLAFELREIATEKATYSCEADPSDVEAMWQAILAARRQQEQG